MSWLMAAVYDSLMGPLERSTGDAWRAELVGPLRGRVLEIGAGTGKNLDHYGDVRALVLAEPDRHMRKKLAQKVAAAKLAASIDVVSWEAEDLEAPDASFDAVVCTLVLCTVRDPARALAEIRRVLAPGGKLIFLEHVVAEVARARRWQERIDPVWKHVAGGCHLCRDTERTIERAGFVVERIVRDQAAEAPVIVRSMIRGVARASN